MREPMTWRTSPGQTADASRHPAIPSRSPLASRALSFLGALSLLTFAATPVLAESTPTAAPPQFAVESPKAASSLLLSVAHAGKRLVAVGDRGHILLSDDDGKTWTQAKVPTRQLLTSVFFVNERKGWAVGHDAQILVSDDAGSTWTRQFEDLGREAPLLDIWFADEQHGLAVGAYGALLETRDGGQHWEDVSERLDNEDQFHLNAIAAVKGQRPAGGRRSRQPVPLEGLGRHLGKTRRPLRGARCSAPSVPPMRAACWSTACAATCSAPPISATAGKRYR